MKHLLSFLLFVIIPSFVFTQNIVSIDPNIGNNGQTLDVTITGNNTHFDQGTGTSLYFGFDQGSGTTVVNSITISSATTILANITIPVNTYTGDYIVSTINNYDGTISLDNSFHVNGLTTPNLVSIAPNIINAGQTLDVTITGNNTHFDSGTGTLLSFGFDQGSSTTIVNSISAINATTLIANITIPFNTGTGDYDVTTYNLFDNSITLHSALHVNGTISLTGHVIPISESSDGACDGQATVYPYGGTSPYSYLFSNGTSSQNSTNYCSGLNSVVVTDAVGNSIVLDFIVSTPSNVSYTTNFTDSLLVGVGYTTAIENCVINYSEITSVTILNYTFLPNDSVFVTWEVIFGDSSEIVTDIYSLGGVTGVYQFALQLYCPTKSIGQYYVSYDQLYYNAAYAELSEEELESSVSIFPNPFNDQLTIKLENNQMSELAITDITGKIILKQKTNDKIVSINMSNLAAGQYIAIVKNDNSVITRKIIKQ